MSKTIEITKEVVEKWKTLKEHGDIPNLVRLTGKSRSYIYKMFNDRVCTSETALIKVNAFYDKRLDERNNPNVDDQE